MTAFMGTYSKKTGKAQNGFSSKLDKAKPKKQSSAVFARRKKKGK